MIEKNLGKNGVGYYKSDNSNKRDKNDKTMSGRHRFSTSLLLTEATPLVDGEGVLSPGQEADEVLEGVIDTQPTPRNIITEDMIARAMFTLYDNGQGSYQRYKFGITFNPKDDTRQQIQFLGSLTKDMRNFKKYLPEGGEEILENIKGLNQVCKNNGLSKPYVAKLHHNKGKSEFRQRLSNEPYSWAAVCWVPEERAWNYYVRLYDWWHEGEFCQGNLTQQQRSKGIIAHELWINPKYSHLEPKRNPTWAELQQRKMVNDRVV